ncbi:hypothetical protein [Candidatus Pelagibacter sp.]|uniref:hypothetical protein n=1 Tax=Candidatus Pelagibacter sp. TaxID=2024849 RepID=UPI003F87CF11|tara:strand:- start:1076 stop:1846 length:771 start_codon:yes stop_codon:yes gene_type:complete
MLDENFKLNFFYNKDVVIYNCNKFFNEKFYDDLNEAFPKLDRENFDKKNHGKYSLEINSKKFDLLAKNNKTLEKFKQHINSEKIQKKLYWEIYTKLLFANKRNLLRLIKYLRFPSFKNINRINKYLFSKIKLDCEFSYIENMGKIVPHVDSIKEICTFLIYFPDEKLNDEDMDKQESYGTSFWESDLKNFSNKHLILEKDEKEFKEKNKIFYISRFKKNHCCGFLRNDKSWHTVEPVNINPNYIRKSININFILEN